MQIKETNYVSTVLLHNKQIYVTVGHNKHPLVCYMKRVANI